MQEQNPKNEQNTQNLRSSKPAVFPYLNFVAFRQSKGEKFCTKENVDFKESQRSTNEFEDHCAKRLSKDKGDSQNELQA